MCLSYKFILSIFFFCICVSCTNLKKENYDFTFESIKTNISLDKYENLVFANLLIGIPDWIRFHPDSFLIIVDRSTQAQLKIIDLKAKSRQELILQGKGPGEMISPFGLEIDGSDIYVFCYQLSKMIVLSPDNNRKFFVSREFKLREKDLMTFSIINNGSLVFQSKTDDLTRLTFFNKEGELLMKTGGFPPLKNARRILSINEVFSSWIKSSPDRDKIVMACAYTDIIEIFDKTGKLNKRIQGPLGIQLSARNQDVGIGTRIKRDPAYLIWQKLYTDNDEFWVGYNGYKLEHGVRHSQSFFFPQQIFCFDWKGNPLRTYNFKNKFLDFDVDKKSKSLYALIWENEDIVIRKYFL